MKYVPWRESSDNSREIAALIETLHKSEKRLEKLTGGEVDSVTNRDGQTLLLRHAQEQLRVSESARQDAILSALPASVVLLDSHGTILSVNEAWRQFGRANAACSTMQDVGVNYLTVCDRTLGDNADEASQAAAGIRAVLDGTANAFSFEYPCHSPEEQRWFMMTVTPLAGNSSGVVVMHQDISAARSAEKALRESDRRFSDLLENVNLVSVMLDCDARITYCNDFLLRLTGWQREEVMGKLWWDIFASEELSDLNANVLTKLLTNHPDGLHHENEIHTRTGQRRLIRWSNSVLRSADQTIVGTASIGEDITERTQAADKLAANEALLREFIRHTPAAIAMLDTQMRYIQTSERWMQDYKIVGQEIIGKSHYDIFPEIDQRWKDIHRRVLAGAIEHCDEDPFLRSDGSTDWLEWQARPWYQSNDQVGGIIFFTQVITERKQAEASIAHLNRVLLVLNSINSLIVRVRDHEELFKEACNIAVEAGGFQAAIIAIVDQATMLPISIISSGNDESLLEAINDVTSSTEGLETTLVAHAVKEKQAVIANDTQNDSRLLFVDRYAELGVGSIAVLPLVISDEAVGILALFAREREFFKADEMRLLSDLAGDIAYAIDHIVKQERLNYLAYYDVLTGLANRTFFLERAEQFMRSASSGGHELAICLIDLERFKNINDTLGRAAGDSLLKQVSKWLTHFAGDANQLGRIGADSFAFVIAEVKSDGNLAKLVERLMSAFLEHSFELNHAMFRIGIKLGIAVFPGDGYNADILLRNAEAAVKKAKIGGDRYLFYTQKMTEAVAGMLTLENQLRQALDSDEFVLHYQPKVDLLTGRMTGAEALIRWNDPRTGLVPPGMFIPILEETGLIYEVGRWALHKAISDYLCWRAAGLPVMRIAVNVSPQQLRNSNFVDEIRQAVSLHPNAAEGLELEITEGMVMEDIRHSIDSLKEIRALGVTIAIDDFGTGFSSLSYLAKLPVDTLKIDRAFVIEMGSPEGVALVSTIIVMAHALKLKVVAEGVETEMQRRQLLSLNCDEMQGFLISKSVPGDLFESNFLKQPTTQIVLGDTFSSGANSY